MEERTLLIFALIGFAVLGIILYSLVQEKKKGFNKVERDIKDIDSYNL